MWDLQVPVWKLWKGGSPHGGGLCEKGDLCTACWEGGVEGQQAKVRMWEGPQQGKGYGRV